MAKIGHITEDVHSFITVASFKPDNGQESVATTSQAYPHASRLYTYQQTVPFIVQTIADRTQ
jgi:hypothetical protein